MVYNRSPYKVNRKLDEMRFPRIYLSVVHPIEGKAVEMESWIMFLCEVCYNRPSLGLCIISRCQTRSSVLPFFFPEMKLSKRSHLLRAQSEIFRELCIKIYLLKRHLILYNFIEERIWCYIKIKLSNRQACVSFSYYHISIVFN